MKPLSPKENKSEEVLGTYTVEPRSTDTCLIGTPRYYGQFCLSRQKVGTFFLNNNPLITDTR